jgi:hypothetical protein
MSAHASWQEGNTRYLAAGLSWLRLRLERMAAGNVDDTDALQDAEKEFSLCESQMDPPPALTDLTQRLGLSRFEQQVLLLCAAMELDTRTAELCARAQGDAARRYPTFALALALFADAAWDALSPERPLRHWRLIDIQQSQTQALTTSALRADERIANYIKGLNHLDERLLAMLSRMDMASEADVLQPSQQASVERIVHALSGAMNAPTLPAIQLLGIDAPSKHLVAANAAARFGRHLYRVNLDMLPTSHVDLEAFARLWQRECMLLPIALLIECGDGAVSATGHTSLCRFLTRSDGLFFIDARELLPRLGRAHVAVDVAKPTSTEQREAWSAALGEKASDSPAALSAQFDLDITTIQRIADAATLDGPANEQELSILLWDECKAAVRPALDALAHRIDAKATWDDIVLPAEQLALMRQICAQVRCRNRVYEDWGFARKMNRGLGISALFEGASGVGKTMAAEVIANDLRINLYRIDLSTVISKYIGETECNLRRLFDAAEDGGAILFFDECDALFSRRSEVKDSHDRYANIETNYLLQRIEAYGGLAILATNMKSSLDVGFVRRLRFIVNFRFPGPAERRLIWRKAFPPGAPREELDFERLGRINLAGGSIHSAALCAAFLAAQGRSAVDMGCVMSAIRTEFMKLGRPINEADFRVLREDGVVA